MSYLTEAFKALDALNEDTFSVSDDGIKKLAEFEDNDDLVDEITVYDADAEDTEDLEDSYVGKVIVDCNVCHSKIYKDKSDVVIDEETQNANIDEECPYCYSTDGFKVIGEVAPMSTETEEKVEVEDDIKESCKSEMNESKNPPEHSIDIGTRFTVVKPWEYDSYDNFTEVFDDEDDYEAAAERFIKKHPKLLKDDWIVFPKGSKFEFIWMSGIASTIKSLDYNIEIPVNLDYFEDDIDKGFFDFDDSTLSLDESLNEATTDRIQNLLNIIDKSFEVDEDTPINEDILDEDNKIRLSAIPGVTRNREGDFTDDGNRFQAYLYKGLIPITYLRAGDEVYITIAFHDLANINYEEYKEFPSYTHANDFNGVSVGNFDPQVFKKNLDAAYDDVNMFLDNVEEVDSEQLEDRIKVINSACKEYEEKVKQYIKDNALKIMKLSDYQFRNLKDYVSSAGNRTVNYIRNASSSSQRHFMSQDLESLKRQISNSWNFEYIENILNSVKESFNEATVTDYKGILSNILVKNQDKISKMSTKGEIVKFLDSITDEVRDKNYLETVKRNMQKKNDFGALQYIYGIILSGEGKGVTESLKENIGTDIDEYQQWVDYDMKRYGKISDQTNKEIKEAGLQVVKDKYGDYQVIAGKYDESLKESVKNESLEEVEVETGDTKVEISSDEDGKITVSSEPCESEETPEDNAEAIKPISDETEAEIEANDGEEDIDIEDFDEESFDELGEGYFKNVYENVNSFKASNITTKGNKVIVEGVITFDNNVKKNTSFLFESANKTKNGKYRFIGENLNVTKGNKAFSLIGNVTDKKFLSESMNYNYRTKNDIGKFIRCCGTIKRG